MTQLNTYCGNSCIFDLRRTAVPRVTCHRPSKGKMKPFHVSYMMLDVSVSSDNGDAPVSPSVPLFNPMGPTMDLSSPVWLPCAPLCSPVQASSWHHDNLDLHKASWLWQPFKYGLRHCLSPRMVQWIQAHLGVALRVNSQHTIVRQTPSQRSLLSWMTFSVRHHSLTSHSVFHLVVLSKLVEVAVNVPCNTVRYNWW